LGWRPDLGGIAAEIGCPGRAGARARVNAVGGHATLVRAADEVRRNVDVFHPQADGLAALGERVRRSFDPKIILNRGRLMRVSVT
jgi:glycolate oxidase FAD binding subunit